ncbi:uncharacterized protein PpBr36_11457 [Pyricularia pennisetigena]|uniref:uncharacterized protein n=1 Tax=Pyricularia pennisetigena TaxID=1578925 RepID=UPI001150E0B4|nr:uncharacterized protein PpBr36_11457 [Pyricularia pennisetigena]TLS20259.1 hypothetical protein PpBr36_11457 [Pyricularia pennisetigena]
MENKEMVDSFIETGNRLNDKPRRTRKRCERPMLGFRNTGNSKLRTKAGVRFVDRLLGREYELGNAETLWPLSAFGTSDEVGDKWDMGRANCLYKTRWEEQNQLRRAQPCRPFAIYVFKYDLAGGKNMAIRLISPEIWKISSHSSPAMPTISRPSFPEWTLATL